MRKLVIVHKPMFKKKFHIEAHYYNHTGRYIKVILCGYEFYNEIDAKNALLKLQNEELQNA